MTRLELYIIRLKPIQAIFRWLNSIYLPRFEGVSLFDSLNFSETNFLNRFYTRASSISFSFIMALPPLLLFFLL